MTPALFLDRDGVINIDKGYVYRTEDVVLRPGITDIVRGFRALGHTIIVVTNQSGIGRGYYTEAQYRACNAEILGRMKTQGAQIDAVYHCPHTTYDACECRKPAPSMILRAAKDWDIDLAHSTLIGDKVSDIKSGLAAGVGHLILWRNKETWNGTR